MKLFHDLARLSYRATFNRGVCRKSTPGTHDRRVKAETALTGTGVGTTEPRPTLLANVR
ncbi:hypothetical protein BCEP4_690015 [Burkholderia cepacia]|nr:hypothetical protein BCEP4_690015 [Burkholderia cepacia]